MSPLRRQFVFTLLLLPLTFGLWYAAGSLFAAPAVWLFDQLLDLWIPGVTEGAVLDGTQLVVATHWGAVDGQVMAAAEAGNQLVFEVNTRLVSYGIAFYAALLAASADDRIVLHFSLALGVLWCFMALGFAAMLAKDLMINVGPLFLGLPMTPPATMIALLYQFSVLLAPTLLPVAIWAAQLRGSPLWDALATGVREAAGAD